MKQKRRCVVKKYYPRKIHTNEKKKRREPLKQVIHSYQFHLAQFKDINYYLIYISQSQSL
jgi:hypothetical protein